LECANAEPKEWPEPENRQGRYFLIISLVPKLQTFIERH